VLVVDEESRKLIDNVVKEDDILNENITSTPYAYRSVSA
jgi:syntaxin-binding protein 1